MGWTKPGTSSAGSTWRWWNLEPITDEDPALERTEYLGGTLESHSYSWVDVRRDMTRFDALGQQQLIEQQRHPFRVVAQRLLPRQSG